MNANSETGEWGGGDQPPSAPDPDGDRAANETRVNELMELDAKEAVAILAADGGAAKLDLEVPDFPGPIAEACYWDDSTIVGIQGPVGSGKTTTVLKSRLRRAMVMPRSVIDGRRYYKLLVIRENYRLIWSTTIPDFLKVFPAELGDWVGGRGGPATFTMLFDDGQGEIEFIAEFMAFGDNVEAALRGYQATDIWLHEMDTNPIEVLTNGITRIKRHPGMAHFRGYALDVAEFGQLVGDFNAPQPDNWVTLLFHDPAGRDKTLKLANLELPEGAPPVPISFYRQPGYGEVGCENLENLAAGYYPDLIGALTMVGRSDKIDRLVYNRIVHQRAGEPVFLREFRRSIHVAQATIPPVPRLGLRIGLDQGFKGAAIVAQFLTPRRWIVLGELHFPNEHIKARAFGDRLAEMLERRWPGWPIEAAWADMAGEARSSLATDESATWNLLVGRAAGFRVRPQRIGTNRINPRLEAVRAALEAPLHAGNPGMLIDPSCSFLIAGFEARYVWTDEVVNASGDRRKVPDKRLTEANVMDALQYLLLSEHRANGLSPISFPEGERVSAPLWQPPGRPLGDKGGLTHGYDILNPYGGR